MDPKGIYSPISNWEKMVLDQSLSPGIWQHSLFVISLANFRAHYAALWPKLSSEFTIRHDEYEDFYDWCVAEGLSRYSKIRFHIEVKCTYRHDIYEMAEEEGRLVNFMMAHFDSLFHLGKLNLFGAASVKVLVAGDIATIAIGINPNV